MKSPLYLNGGFALFNRVPGPRAVYDLHQEALRCYPAASAHESWAADHADGRGGDPKRKLIMTAGGPVQQLLYRAEWVSNWLTELCGFPARPGMGSGSYSYYVRAGDFLGLHRDIVTCDVTVITVLQDNTGPSDVSGGLVIYPERIKEPLSSIRARPSEGARTLKLAVGQTVVILGGILPHQVVPTRPGQQRIISALCFDSGLSANGWQLDDEG